MTLRDLQMMVTIADEKSISRAAVKLFLAQPALSQCLRKVEKELGTVVFVRINTGVVPTEEGEVFLEFARETLGAKSTMEKKMEDLRTEEHGIIHLGLTGTQAAYVLPSFLPEFNERHPRVEIILVEASSTVVERKLMSGECDVGILHPPILEEGLTVFELSHDEMVVIPRSRSRFQPYIYYQEGERIPYLNIDFLRDEPVLFTQGDQRSRQISDGIFERAGFLPKIKQISNHLITLDTLAQVDYGTVLLPAKQISEPLKRRGYYRLDQRFRPWYPFLVAYRKAAYQSAAVKKLLEVLEEKKGTF